MGTILEEKGHFLYLGQPVRSSHVLLLTASAGLKECDQQPGGRGLKPSGDSSRRWHSLTKRWLAFEEEK